MPLLLLGAVLCSEHIHAQELPAAERSRIEQMRDQAELITVDEATSDQSAETAAVFSDEPDESSPAVETPLPPNESLPLGAGEGDLFTGNDEQVTTGSLGDGWFLSTLAALGVVLAIVFTIRWLLKRGGVVSPSVSQGSVVEVLSRTTIAPRSHVVLMRVGQRILVVCDSPAGMRTLASVHEAEEVAELLGAIDASKPASISYSFGSVMKKLSGQWSGEDDGYVDEPGAESGKPKSAVDQAEGALSQVRGRLAALSETGGRA
ncbi:MAG: flagellar biosynthetic protein FliO [Planctomycetota bacterium]